MKVKAGAGFAMIIILYHKLFMRIFLQYILIIKTTNKLYDLKIDQFQIFG